MYSANFKRIARNLGLLALTVFSGNILLAQVKISEQKWTLPTYEIMPADKNPMFFKGESYQGASKVIYPYALNDAISNERTTRDWKALILENEYIQLCVAPEIGGKLYYATDKSTNYNFIYKNNVVKPSNIGMTGAWVSGGIEWCVLHHHRASTFQMMDYDLQVNPDSSKTIWIGETEPRQRMRWTIGITMYPGKSYYQTEVKIHNPTPVTNTFLYWANVAAHTNENYQIIFPPSVDVVTYHAKNSFAHWPYATEVYNGEDFTKGVDISYWKNAVNQNSFFAHDLKEDFMGGYDHGKETGTVHIGDHNVVKGAKLWEWGSGPVGQATEGKLTENDGPYVEIMVGAFSDNQPDYSWIRPYEVKTFKQYWYPVKDIQGFKNANLNGAVNLEKREGHKVFLGYYSTSKVNDARIVLRNKGKVIFEKNTSISPETAFTSTINVEGEYAETDLSTEMTNGETGEILVSYQPVERKQTNPLPEEVKRPASPKEMETIEELYLTGSRIQQFGNPTLNAMDYFKEALERDPSDIRTNIAVGNTHLKNGEYTTARKYFGTAIKRLTKDYTRPSNCEALYLQGITLKALGLYDEAVDTLYRATWDYSWHSAAYLELARISCLKGNYSKALEQVNHSLSTNSTNNSAIALKASLERKLGQYAPASKTLASIVAHDPLDFRAGNENYLIAKDSGNESQAGQLLSYLNRKMRDFEQNYLELAAGYMNDGLNMEAEDVLRRFKGKNQEVSYLLGYFADHEGNTEEAVKRMKEASSLPVDYGFPFRLEMIKVFELASKYNPSDARPFYYLGNLLYDKQPQKAISYWEKAVALDPTLAIAHRNLGWGYYYFSQDVPKAIAAYEKAVELKKDDPVYYAELDPLYELSNTPIERRSKLFDSVNDVVKKRDDSFVREIIVLNLAGQPEKSVEYLSNSVFHFREGSSRVRDITVDARILLGKKFLEQKKYKEALDQFLASVETTETTKPGKYSGDPRSAQINYFIGLGYEALGNKSKAKSYFTMASGQSLRESDYINYYKGLSYLKLGEKAKAEACFNKLVEEGEKKITQGSEVDFFAKFGEKESAAVQQSNAHLLKGLGYKGLGEKVKAEVSLRKALELSVSNLWARVELGK